MRLYYAPLNHELIPSLQKMEVSSSLQLPSFHIVGLAGQEVAEARERVRAAIQASRLEFPRRRVVLNLSPASIRKRGTGADLAMALAILEDPEGESPEEAWMAWGELGLEGQVKDPGQAFRAVHAAWRMGIPEVLLASAARNEELERRLLLLRLEAGTRFFPRIHWVGTLEEALERVNLPNDERAIRARAGAAIKVTLTGDQEKDTQPQEATFRTLARGPDPAELLPLEPALARLVGVAAAGCHHLLLLGPRGSGKSCALDWMPWLLPPPGRDERIQRILTDELLGVRGERGEELAPVRRVGTGVKSQALLGSFTPQGLRPGELGLAHGGLLLADEFPEWTRDSREALRVPLERGVVHLNRVAGSVELPARFLLAASGNLCPCGLWDGTPADAALPVGASTSDVSRALSSTASISWFAWQVRPPENRRPRAATPGPSSRRFARA
jgi:magnesium chelatase family protein